MLLFGLTAATVSMAFPWGSTAHHLINLKAPMHLPSSMGTLKADSLFYAAHASDPDYRKNSSDTSFWAESPRHFIDIDWYPNFHSLPHSLDSVIALYGRSTVRNQGLNPWATVMVLDSLTAQIRRGDAARIETTMSDLGHYVADAHQPLHCAKNYDGQLTGNSGIHSRYETTMINDYQNSIIIHSDSIHYISSPVDFIFDYTYHSNLYVDSIMQADTYAKSVSGWSGSGTAPASYYAALWLKVGGFTTDQIQQATVDLASLWYTAWVNARAPASPFDSIFTTVFGNGQVTPSGIVVIPATHDTTFSFTPQSTYHVDSLLVDGVRTDSLVTYTFYNVVSNHALRVWFGINKDTITAVSGSNGSISPSGTVNVNYGANQQFTITPTAGYLADSVIVDGVKVDSTTSYTFTDVTTGHTIRVTFRQTAVTLSLNVRSRWNMVSIPVTVIDDRTSILFSSASSKAFAYENGYTIKDTLTNGIGYWIKFIDTQTVVLTGVPITKDTITVQEGWNLIGSISTPVATTQLTSDPGGIVTSQFFGYEGRYVTRDSIQPGQGYWVKVIQSGKLILATPSSVVSASNRIRIVASEELPPAVPDDNQPLSVIPKVYALDQNYPNPFNPATTIRYQLPMDSRVTLKVYNTLGQVVGTLAVGVQSASYQSAEWDASSVASGIYFYRLEATSTADPTQSFTQVKKMLLVK